LSRDFLKNLFAFFKAIQYHYVMEKDDLVFMTRDQVMQYLKISKGTLYKLMKRHDFPYFKLEKKVLFRRSDIDTWIQAKEVK